MEGEKPARRPNRLREWNYDRAGYYFLTVCVAQRRCLLRRGAHCAPELPPLTEMGRCTEWAITEIPAHYPGVVVDKYVVMPNHVHMILALPGDGGRTMCAPTVSRIIKQFKGAVTKRVGRAIWQKSFYDHVIRDEADYLRIWDYMDTNPARWAKDCYYEEELSLC